MKYLIRGILFGMLFFTIFWLSFYFGSILNISANDNIQLWYEIPYCFTSLVILIFFGISTIAGFNDYSNGRK